MKPSAIVAHEGRFQYWNNGSSYAITSIPCYIPDSGTSYKSPSLNSSGMGTSIINNTETYYPAISTYVKFYYKIND